VTILSKNILATIIYYDILDYPMTAFEVWKYLTNVDERKGEKVEAERIGLVKVVQALESEELESQIEQFQGFYFLRGRGFLVEKRLERNKISQQKLKIIRGVVFWLRFLPYVRMVAVTGTVAMKNAGKNSDLDLLVVIRQGRIFFGRTAVTALVHLMGKRRYGKKIANRICLNCFLTDESLTSRLQDVFSASEYFFIVPLLGQRIFLEFKHKNAWIKKFKINFCPEDVIGLKMLCEAGKAKKVRGVLENIFDRNVFNLLESWLEKWQTGRIARDPRTKEDGSIIMADSEALIFFHHAHSLEMDKLFQKRLVEAISD